MERLAWKGRMDLSRVYTKTSKGILEGNTKSREVTREHGRVLTLIDGKSSVADILEKSTRLSENRLAAILDELVEMGMIRQLNAALAVDDFGFSSTIIVGEANTEAFFEAQVNHERELRRAEALAAQDKDEARTTLLNEVKADIQAEAESIKSDFDKRSTQEAQDKAQAGFQRAAEVQSRREADIKAKAEAKIRQAREDAEARAQALAEHARKQFAAESKARQEAEAREKALQAEADAKARMEAEKKARLEAEKKALAAEKAQEAAETKARKVAEQAARLAKEAEAKANAQRVLESKIQAEEEAQRRADMEARLRETEQGKRRAEEEARALAKAAEEQRIATELENRVKRRVEARTREVEAARERAEAEARAKQEEASRLAQEAEAREQAEAAAAKAAQEAQAKLEAERQAKEIAEAQALAEAETQRQSEEARKTREAAEREAEATAAAQAKADADARQHAEAEQRRIDDEKAAEAAKLAAEKSAEEERKAQEARIKAEHEARRQTEAEQRRVEAEKAAEAVRLATEKSAEEERKARDARIKAEHEARRQAEAERRRIEAEKARVTEAARLAAVKQADEERAQREAAELAAQAAAEARAKAEAVAREQAEAEQKRIDAAKAQAAEETRLAAEREAEKERLHAEQQAQEVAQAEEAVRLEAEAAKRQLAEQQHEEDERLAREKLALKQEQEAAAEAARVETQTRAENAARQREEARDLARERAEKAVRAEAAAALRHRQDAEQREEAEEQRLRSEAQSRAMAAAQGAAVFPFLTSRKRKRTRLSKNFIKPLFYSLLGLLVLAIAMLHLVPLNFYIPKLERQLGESIGQRVVVRDVHFSLYPAPHLILEGVTIGDLADVRIGSARVFPTLASWYTEHKLIPRVELTSVALSDDSVGALSIWSQHQARTASMQFEKISVKDAKLQNRLLDLFTFDADVLMRQGRMAKAQIRSTDQRITIDLTPQNDGLAIQLVATGSVLPFEPRLSFDALKIAAISAPGGMTLTQIDGQLYGGSVSGNAQIEWRDGWVFKSDLAVRQIAIAPALALFTRNITVSGTLEAKIRLAAKSDMLETLFNAPQVQATFRARDGELASIDLVRAIQSARSSGNIGGKTHFNELSGNFQFANGRYQYQQLKLTTGMMSANGNVDLSAQQNLSGNLVGELRTRNTALRMPFILGGTLATPSLKVVAPVVRPPAPAPVVSEQEP